jgi:hypothetical protein
MFGCNCSLLTRQEAVSTDTIPRSAQLLAWGDMAFALCGLGDGSLVTFSLDPVSGVLVDVCVKFQPSDVYTLPATISRCHLDD